MKENYEIKLSLSKEQISQILDYRLGQQIEHNSEDIQQLLNVAECIKTSELSDNFCKYFAAELKPLLKELISKHSDSYEITNFQHRMLRKFSDCGQARKIA